MGKNYDKVTDHDRIAASLGIPLGASDFALSAGFGSTASIAVSAGSTTTRGEATITSAGTGQAANPTATLTFPGGAYEAAPFAVATRAGGSQRSVPMEITTRAVGSMVFSLIGTPVAAETYKFNWGIIG
jgi:hypothetical protein